MSTTKPDRLAYTVQELAAAAGVSRAHIYNMKKRGELSIVSFGGRSVVPADQVARLLNKEVAA